MCRLTFSCNLKVVMPEAGVAEILLLLLPFLRSPERHVSWIWRVTRDISSFPIPASGRFCVPVDSGSEKLSALPWVPHCGVAEPASRGACCQRLAATLTFSGESTLPTISNHSSLSISRTQMPQGPSLS